MELVIISPLKNLMMSVKSMLFSKMMSRYISTRARAMKSTKCSEEVCLAAQRVSHTENTSSYTISVQRNPENNVSHETFGLTKHRDSRVSHPTSFEVEKKPTITEVEVSVVSVLLHQFKQLRIQNLLKENQTVRTTGSDTSATPKRSVAPALAPISQTVLFTLLSLKHCLVHIFNFL